MNMPTGWEWILVIILALIVLGPKRLPDLMRSIGDGIRELKKSMNGAAPTNTEDEAPAAPPPVDAAK